MNHWIFRAGDVNVRAIVHAQYQASFCIISCWIRVSEMLANKEANKFLKVGFENLDGNSTMLYLSVNRPSVTKLNPFALLKMSTDEAKRIEDQLKNANFSGMPIVEAEACIATNLTGNCRAVCKPVENFIKKANTDGLQKLHGERVLRIKRCRN